VVQVQLPILGAEDRKVHIPMSEMRKIDLQYSEFKGQSHDMFKVLFKYGLIG
jgi:hypothetical protein